MANATRVFVSSSALFMAVIAAMLAAGCGDDDGGKPLDAPAEDTGLDAPVDAATDAALDAATGQLWIRGNGITGATSKVVLAFVAPAAGGPNQAGICVQVTADPFSFVATARTREGNNPCTLAGPAALATGNYNVTAGIYTPGVQTPERCARAVVAVVNGSGDVTLPAFGSCADT